MRQLSIRWRLATLVLLPVLLGALLLAMARAAVREVGGQGAETARSVQMLGEETKLKVATDVMAAVLQHALAGAKTPEERVRIIHDTVDHVRYDADRSGYFFVYERTTAITVPPRPERSGRDFAGETDSNGLYFIRELADVSSKGGGFVRYVFPKPPDARKTPKLSYAVQLAGTDYWVGTGYYIDNVERDHLKNTAMVRTQVRRASWYMAGVVLAMVTLLFLPLSWAIAWSITKPLGEAVQIAERVGGGDLTSIAPPPSRDELGVLISGLGKMTQALRTHRDELEVLVAGRTEALGQRTRSLQLVLDSTGDGLLVVDRQGAILPGASRAVSAWLGEAPEGTLPVWQYLGGHTPHEQANFRVAFEQLVAEELPFEVCADMMPTHLKAGPLDLEISYRPVRGEQGELQQVLVVLRDVTLKWAAERAEAEAREIQGVLGVLLRDRAGFRNGVDDCDQILERISEEDQEAVAKRLLHTLKGNSAILGFSSFGRACHELEEVVAARSEEGTSALPSAEEIEGLRGAWASARARVDAAVNFEASAGVELQEEEFRTVLGLLEERRDHGEILDYVRAWRYESASTVLARIGAHARRLADQVGRPIEVVIEDHRLRLPTRRLGQVLSTLIHAVRNAIDHGLETPNERAAAGKSPRGVLTLVAKREAGALVLRIGDDGRGIDFEGVAAAARRRGLPATTSQELVDALFADGLTTRDEVTELSGRGVGMAALRDAVMSAGGTIEVLTARGRGTTFELRFPPITMMPSILPSYGLGHRAPARLAVPAA